MPVRVANALLVGVMALAFAGCGGDSEDGTTQAQTTPDTTAEATPTEPTLPPEPSPELVQALRRDANTWASLFALRACNRYLGPPLCDRIRPAFQKSFVDATVEEIEHKGTVEVGPPAGTIYRAAVTFSNGVVVVFGGGRPETMSPAASCPGPGRSSGQRCTWIVLPDRRFIQAATE